jgi:hypothetical protein
MAGDCTRFAARLSCKRTARGRVAAARYAAAPAAGGPAEGLERRGKGKGQEHPSSIQASPRIGRTSQVGLQPVQRVEASAECQVYR